MAALQTSIERLKDVLFDDREATTTRLRTAMERLATLQSQTEAEWSKAKAQRSATMAQEFTSAVDSVVAQVLGTLRTLEKLHKLDDAYVDQMTAIFHSAWNLRNEIGELSVPISNVVAGMQVDVARMNDVPRLLGQTEAHWAALSDAEYVVKLPPKLAQAIIAAKALNLSPEQRELPIKMMKAIISGGPLPVDVSVWSESRVAAFASVIDVALAAIESARERAMSALDAARLKFTVELIGLAAALVFAAGSLLIVNRRVTRPITRMTGSMSRIATGDFREVIPGVGRRDEIGGMATAVQVFKEGLKRNLELEQATARDREAAESRRKDLLAELAGAFEASVGGIVSSVASSARDLESAARLMTQSAAETSQRSTAVAAAAEEASTNVTVVASSAEELGASVNEIGRQVRQSSELSEAAVIEARSTASIVGELSQSANKISEVLGLISTIAGQTNLLALNATIEAVRAGEAGRGFAVVASEVKELANQTAKATADISIQIGSIQQSTGRAVDAISGIAATIETMSNGALVISSAVSQQGMATSEIVSSIAQASAGTSEVTDNISSVANAAKEAGAAAEKVLSASGILSSQATQLRTEVDNFLRTVKAA